MLPTPPPPPPERRGRIAPSLARWVERLLLPLVRRLFRPSLEGVEQLPTAGAYLLVANHSAGIALAEVGCLLALWVARFGTSRPIAAFAHPVGLAAPPASWLLRAVGAVPSTYEAAESTLAAGVPLLVFPGGDHEAMRPLWQANRVDLGGRRGFLRVARTLGVPIVPMGIRGSHLTVPILARSRLLPWLLVWPRAVGVKRWPLTALAVVGVGVIVAASPWSAPVTALLAWAWLASPLGLLPIVPSTIRFRIGAPLPPAALFTAEDPELSRALATVEGALARLVAR